MSTDPARAPAAPFVWPVCTAPPALVLDADPLALPDALPVGFDALAPDALAAPEPLIVAPGVTLGVPKVSVDVVDVDENRDGVEFELGIEELEEAEERRS